MKLAQLKALLTVIDARNFSEAALQLGTSQSAVSYAIAELERELDVRLLERGRFGARPTKIGETVAFHARAMLQHENAISQQVSAVQGQITGKLRVASFRSASGKILPPILADLRKTQSNIAVTLLEVDHLDAVGRSKEQLLCDHEADIALTENPGYKNEHNDLLVWELMTEKYFGLIHADDPRDTLSWKALNQDAFIYSFCAGRISSHLNQLNGEFDPMYRVREDSTILQMVSQNLGVSILPRLAIDELPDNVKIVPMDEDLERIITVAVLPSMLKVPAVRVFLKLLKAYFPASEIPACDLPETSSRAVA